MVRRYWQVKRPPRARVLPSSGWRNGRARQPESTLCADYRLITIGRTCGCSLAHLV